MKIEILLPTQYITNGGELAYLDKELLGVVEEAIVQTVLKYEVGVLRSRTDGYYKSYSGVITKSTYIVLTVYTENIILKDIIFNSSLIPSICKELKQESIGIIADNTFIYINKRGIKT